VVLIIFVIELRVPNVYIEAGRGCSILQNPDPLLPEYETSSSSHHQSSIHVISGNFCIPNFFLVDLANSTD